MWEGGHFKLEVTFPDGTFTYTQLSRIQRANISRAEYPTKPPKCKDTQISTLPCSRSGLTLAPRQVYTAALPPERLPLRHRLPIDSQRGGRLETRNHNQGHPARNPIATRRAESRFARSGRCLRAVQERQGRIREKDPPHCEGQPGTLSGQVVADIRPNTRPHVRSNEIGPLEKKGRWLARDD